MLACCYGPCTGQCVVSLSLLCLGGAHQGLAPLDHTPVLNHWFSGCWALFKRAVLCYSSLDRWLVCIYPGPVPINLRVVIRYCKVSKIEWSLIIHEHICLHFPTLTERLHTVMLSKVIIVSKTMFLRVWGPNVITSVSLNLETGRGHPGLHDLYAVFYNIS